MASMFYWVLFICVAPTLGWQYFTTLNEVVMYSSKKQHEDVHSEYSFGDCRRKGQVLYTHIHLDHMQVLGKLIVRGYIDVPRIPTCIYFKLTAYAEDLFRNTAYQFQICVPRVTYCHSRRRYKYYYYELYVPTEMVGGMNYEIYFYGPPEMSWQ